MINKKKINKELKHLISAILLGAILTVLFCLSYYSKWGNLPRSMIVCVGLFINIASYLIIYMIHGVYEKIYWSTFFHKIEIKSLRKKYKKISLEIKKCNSDKTNLYIIVENQLTSFQLTELQKETIFDSYLKKLEFVDKKKELLDLKLKNINKVLMWSGIDIFAEEEMPRINIQLESIQESLKVESNRKIMSDLVCRKEYFKNIDNNLSF